MPDSRAHRGPHPQDLSLFGVEAAPRLRIATAEMAWLLGRGYGPVATLKLVGDRHRLDRRQRTAVRRATCTDAQRGARQAKALRPSDCAGRALRVDGLNLVTTVEAALGGGVLLRCRDGALRDMASVHGNYRRVEETAPAVDRIGQHLAALGVGPVRWLLDQPVSNSGRLATLIRSHAEAAGWDWTVELVPDPDRLLVEGDAPVASADAAVIDGCAAWVNLSAWVVDASSGAAGRGVAAWILDLR